MRILQRYQDKFEFPFLAANTWKHNFNNNILTVHCKFVKSVGAAEDHGKVNAFID